MMITDLVQNLIHRLEVGGGMRFFRIGLAVVAMLLVPVVYNWRAYKNMSTQEAMDSAQLARNLAQGKGYTTLFIRPFSLCLVKRVSQETQTAAPAGVAPDLSQIKGLHPDLANPPVYPFVLAGLMKVLPFRWPVNTTDRFWSVPAPRISAQGKAERMFWRYEPDFLIALFNQLLFFGVIISVFFLARRLFDAAVAWLTAALMLGSELLWRFTVSGLSTILLLLIFMGVVWCLTLLEEETRTPKWGQASALILAGVTGLLVGLGGLTRYGFLGLIVPVLVFVVLFTGRQRVVLAIVTVLVFAAVVTPWLVRNYSLSGAPFGTATYTILENSSLFPEYRLQRSIDPDLSRPVLVAFWQKLMGNARLILQNDLPRLGGSWVTAFFLVGLLVGFNRPTIRRLRYFLLITLGVFALTQALGRTQLTEDSPELNSENLLVLASPLVLLYGVSLFFLVLEQIALPFLELRYITIGLFGVITSMPLLLTFLPPKTIPVAYPPYFPPAIQKVGGWLKEDELSMSDVPWAMAWYGQRRCVWLTLNSRTDFFAINDYQKPIAVLYLTPATMDNRFLSQWILPGELSWGSFITDVVVKREIPPYFPLHKTEPGWLPNQLVLADWERWRKTP